MSQVTIYFGVAPAIAPIIGGWLFVHAGWHSIFWFLTAVGVVAVGRQLPLAARDPARHAAPAVQRAQPDAGLLAARARTRASCCWRWPAACPSTACSCTCCAAPAFLGEHLGLAPTQFFWFFVLTISGIMGGAWVSGRLAGRISPRRQIRYGFTIMLLVSLVNVAANFAFQAQRRPGRCCRSRYSPSAGR